MNAMMSTELKHLAEKPELSPRIWGCYGRDQVALEMQARFEHQGISRHEVARLCSYLHAGTTYSYPYPNQGATELCGPAAIAYDLMLTDATAYASAVVALYETGVCAVGDLSLHASEELRGSYREGISAIDWMFLAAMREGRNKFFGVDGDAGPLALFTPPRDMLYWLRCIYPHEQFRQRLSFLGWRSEQAHRRALLDVLSKPTRAFLLIDMKLVKEQSGGNRFSRLHWIVVKPGSVVWSEDGEQVSLTYFTWGAERVGSFRVKDFVKYLYVTIERA